ncbi:3-isopropylmalate dehydrogenase [Prochlorococcus marinus]|uniref:3-isopropylmalate dehydrogenase n=1 Tax=Prochlorococcus marinus (strain MIT 9211) TaxID=93059 RepID=A9BAP4_PROM4|nr:3-isopropylmalate dehydrogenase [Prochlorococcus marinus]ABX08906.1 3-isopropylmalate dehydrogenase [Prochlorococcus marinus str. MIT 9211]
MKTYNVVLLPGDGIGPEIMDVATKTIDYVAQKYNFGIEYEQKLIGGSAIDKYNDPLPEETLKACKSSDAVLLSAIGSPKYDALPREKRPESGLLNLRSGLGLFANIRPVKVWPALISESSLKQEIVQNVDLVVVRELTGGIYFGQPKGRLQSENGERAFNTMTYSTMEIDRIARVAFELATDRKKKLCSIDKANVLDVSQLWRERVIELSYNFPKVELNHLYVDNAAMQLIRQPDQFDVILTGNLFGDIISDEAAMLTGSIGMLPSASLRLEGPGLFEPVHGSAPDIANKDIANPMAMVLSAAMMLRVGLKENNAADDLENAIDKVLKDGYRTSDLMTNGKKVLGCREMGEQILMSLAAA